MTYHGHGSLTFKSTLVKVLRLSFYLFVRYSAEPDRCPLWYAVSTIVGIYRLWGLFAWIDQPLVYDLNIGCAKSLN